MPKGGRRHRKSNAQHKAQGTLRKDRHGRGDVVQPPKAKPPRPPRGLGDVERRAWREVARQVEAVGTYAASDFSIFRLAVKALAAVDAAPVDLKASTLKGLLETAAKLLARLGCDPIARQQVDVPKTSPEDLARARAEAFLFGRDAFARGDVPLVGPACPRPPPPRGRP